MPIFESEHLWEKHALYHPEEGNYMQCLKKAKDILNSKTLIVTKKFVIIETKGYPESLVPVLVRCINFVHGGNKIIVSLDKILFVPDWCDDSAEVILCQMAETYVAMKLKSMTHWERFKFNSSMLVASFQSTGSFNKVYMEMLQQLPGTVTGSKVNFL